MQTDESFKSLLEALLGDSISEQRARQPSFTKGPELGAWAQNLRVQTPPSRQREGFEYYREFQSENITNEDAENNQNAPPKRPEIPSVFEWNDEVSTAKMIFNTYQDLRITEDSPLEDVKKAYRSLLFLFHPDHNEGDPEAHERFLQLQKAFLILKRTCHQK